MEIKEFVKDIIINLDTAITEAARETSREVYFTQSQNSRTIEFDIAVFVEDLDNKDIGAKIKVLELIDLGGSGSKQNKNSTVSRIKFGVNIGITKNEYNTHTQSSVINNDSAK